MARLRPVARRVPLPDWVRRGLVWRSQTYRVPVDKVLLGGQNGHPAAQVAEATGDLLWASRHVTQGPHVALLRAGAHRRLDDAEILTSSYADLARACIRTSGQYFSATDDAGILDLARDFLARDTYHPLPGGAPLRPHQTPRDGPIRLVPIAGSSFYQVVDGHHRIAAGVLNGGVAIEAKVRRRPVTTPLQDLLDAMSWIGGQRELYQPIDAPELADSWTTVRRCSDRLTAMTRLLDELAIDPAGSSSLDVASCYGWFVAQLAELGFDAHGVERDPLAPQLGASVYGLDPHRIHVADAVDFLGASGQYDVVSCFSLLHHFVLGRGRVDAVELLQRLDAATGRVLFLDTGQSHEAWFHDSLPQWDTDFVRRFLEQHGSFDRVVDLGPDHDAVAPYEHNYGRHLFACVRD